MSRNYPMVRMLIETKNGVPCLWEEGGMWEKGGSDRGESTIIAGKDGRPKRAVRKGQLANGEHALVVLEPGDFVINAYYYQYYQEDFQIEIYKIIEFEERDKEMYAVAKLYNGKYHMDYQICKGLPEWEEPLPSFLEDAVQAAMAKATCYNCREPYFAII